MFKDSIQQLKHAMKIKPDVKPINIGSRHRVIIPSGSPKKVVTSQNNKDVLRIMQRASEISSSQANPQ